MLFTTKYTYGTKALRIIPTLLILMCFLQMYRVVGQSKTVEQLLGKINSLRSKDNFQKTDTLYINTLLDIASNQRYYNLDSLYILASQGLTLSEKANYIKGQSEAYTHLGSFCSDKGKHDEAIQYFDSALKLARELELQPQILLVINNLGGEYAYKGNYAMALKEYLSGIELAERYQNKQQLSILNENIANLYISQKDFEQGMLFYNRVKIINQEIGNPTFMAETMSNMASAYADMGELDLAMYTINSSITVFEKEKIMDWLAYAYETKGKVYLKQEKFDWAMYWYKQSELIHTQLDDERAEIALLIGMAEANLGAKNDSISEIYALKAMGISTKLESMSTTKDIAKILYALNKNKGDHENALHYHELYQSLSDTLSRKENQQSLTLLKTKTEYDQQKEELVFENEKALATQKTYVYATLFCLIIFLCITFLVRKNERIQKKLNKELLSKQLDLENSEQHLTEVNRTKDKLFSIIGHDLRGPIGAFQGLIKLFHDGEVSKEEFLDFVPKLKTDIDNISFTLNNLLSWGQTQMNGSVTSPGATSLEHIVQENIDLLSEIAANKSIKLLNRIESNTITYSDSNQVDIVIRNLLSNALKFTPEHGTVTIGAVEKTKHWEVYVRDTGIGMNEETLGKIFNTDTTHTTYGTNDEKGTGLGLSLCKEMVEKNEGILWVDSAVSKGSNFYFTIPKGKKILKKSA